MKNTILLFFIFFVAGAYAQFSITGKVINTQKPVEYAEVILMKEKQTYSDFTSVDGTFNIKAPAGSYTFVIRQWGKELYTKPIELTQNINLQTIIVENTNTLETVTVQGNKKLIERKVDRLVFNVENSLAATGGNAIDVLGITPRIQIKDEKIGITGKSGILVLVNDKRTYMTGEDLMNYLKTINANDISKIEVITNPPSKYDAEGDSGVVNIVLKKSNIEGINGSIQSTTQKPTHFNSNNSANLNYQKNNLKIAWRGSYFYSNIHNTEFTNNQNQTTTLINDAQRDYSGNAYSTSLNLDYSINKKTAVGVIYNFSNRKYNGNGQTATYNSFLNQNFDSEFNYKNKSNTNTIIAYLSKEVGKSGGKMNLESAYVENNGDLNTNNYSNSTLYTSLFNTNTNGSVIRTVQLDFELPNKFCKIETGAKTSFTNASYTTQTQTTTLDKNTFNIKECIQAAYFDATKELDKKWSVNAGIRTENTILTLFPENTDQTKINYLRFFPKANIQFNQNDNVSWSLGYNYRISRPNYNDYNPYKQYSNSYSYSTGNLNLIPSYSHNIELGFTYKNFNVSLFYTKTNNTQGMLTSIQNNFQVNQQVNMYNFQSVGIDMGFNKKILKFWETAISTNANYQKATSSILLQPTYTGTYAYINCSNNFAMNKEKTIVLFANFWQTLRSTTDYRIFYPNANFSFGGRYSLLDKKLQLSLRFNDFFHQEIKHALRTTEYGTVETRTYFDSKRWAFTVLYKFGGNKIKTITKNRSVEEQSRATIKDN